MNVCSPRSDFHKVMEFISVYFLFLMWSALYQHISAISYGTSCIASADYLASQSPFYNAVIF